MRTRVRRMWSDLVVSAGVLLVVLITLMSIDVRVREQVTSIVGATSTVQSAGGRIAELGSVLFEAARTQSLDHGPMMIFIAAATVLVLFMARS